MHSTPRPWGEAEDATLAKLWAEGLSAAQISRALGTGRSRNAVIGRIHRRRLPMRASSNSNVIERKIRNARQRATVVKVPRFNKEKAPPLADELARVAALKPIEPALGVLGLTNFTCRYPIGDPTDPAFTFCGRTCNNVENPYCVQHARLCYAPAQAKKREHDRTARLANWLDRRSFKVAA